MKKQDYVIGGNMVMDLFKSLGEKAKDTAKIVGERSSDMVEIGKLKRQISQIEGDIRKLKTEIGQYFYDAYAEQANLVEEEIISICEDIKGKYTEIEELKEKIYKMENY